MFNYHFESNAIVRSPVNQAFAYIDDHTRLSSHMSESSWKMGGGQMEFVLDEGGGQKIGSQIRLVGRVFGIELSVDVLKRKVPGTMSQRLAGGWCIWSLWFISSVWFFWFLWFRSTRQGFAQQDKQDKPNKLDRLPLNHPPLTQNFDNTAVVMQCTKRNGPGRP